MSLKHQFNKKPISFAERVIRVVKNIPKGSVMSYGDVAAAAGRPGAARAVGNVMMRNKDKNIPCHRVILSSGKAGGYNGLLGKSGGEKERLLRKEGYNYIGGRGIR